MQSAAKYEIRFTKYCLTTGIDHILNMHASEAICTQSMSRESTQAWARLHDQLGSKKFWQIVFDNQSPELEEQAIVMVKLLNMLTKCVNKSATEYRRCNNLSEDLEQYRALHSKPVHTRVMTTTTISSPQSQLVGKH